MIPVAGFAALVAAPAPSTQAPTATWCRNHPDRVGACRQVHGRLKAYNGTPTFRIWVVGTHRLIAPVARDWRESEQGGMLPANVRAAIGRDAFRVEVFADFEVCPVERQRQGWMQHVCLVSARRLHVARYGD